jgi:hypothetical protein
VWVVGGIVVPFLYVGFIFSASGIRASLFKTCFTSLRLDVYLGNAVCV